VIIIEGEVSTSSYIKTKKKEYRKYIPIGRGRNGNDYVYENKIINYF